jgi:hypothetical protein
VFSQKLVIYFTANGHALYRWSGGALELESRFTPDDAGLEEFRGRLRGRAGALVYVLADLAGEDFHEDQIPYLRGGDRQAVVERRLAQRYRDTRLAAALTLGYATGERRSERLLLASFTNTQQFTAWLDALAEAGTRLSGVYSVPLLAPALAARLGVRGGRAMVVSVNSAGLRQCFVEEGRLRFARLERTVEMAPEALASFVRTETGRLAQYLSTLRVLPREGPPVHVIVVAPPGQREAFERALVSDARLSFVTLELAQATRKAGLRSAPADIGAEQLYLHLAVKRPPREQFAKREDRRSFYVWQLQRGLVAAGALGLAACALYAGVLWVDANGMRGGAAQMRAETQQTMQQYQRITSAFPVTQTTTDNLRATVNEFRNLARRNAAPRDALVYISRVMDDFPQVELDAVNWRLDRADGRTAAAPGTGAPAAAATASSGIAQVLELSGRVSVARRSDYRAITAEVQEFANALRTDPAYRVLRTQLPFDVTPEGTLSGDMGTASDTGEAPRFTIVLARDLP